MRAELLYQAPGRVGTGERHERVRLVAVRFLRAAGAAPTAPAIDPRQVAFAEVPHRVFSEAIRDVSLVASVAATEPDH